MKKTENMMFTWKNGYYNYKKDNQCHYLMHNSLQKKETQRKPIKIHSPTV